jgi:hypothetical protein
MAYNSPCDNAKNDVDFISCLSDYSKALSLLSPATPSTILSNISVSLSSDKQINICKNFARTTKTHSTDECIQYNNFDVDRKLVKTSSFKTSPNDDERLMEVDNDFKISGCEFGDFNVSPDPITLSQIVAQFAKIVKEEEKFVMLYKQYFKNDPVTMRKALESQGFEFTKAKIVIMQSSQTLT